MPDLGLAPLFASAAFLGFALLEIRALKSGAPYVPSGKKTVEAMLGRAGLKSGETLVDLGSGDGTILFHAARHGARAVGVEQSAGLCLWTRFWALVSGNKDSVSVIRGNLFDADLRQVDVVTCFLLQDTNQRLAKKLQSECRPGTRVVSHAFTFVGWKEEPRDPNHPLVHLYKIQNS